MKAMDEEFARQAAAAAQPVPGEGLVGAGSGTPGH
jgi:hypothetical protein